MEDTDLYPCPWCRGELVSIKEARSTYMPFHVMCESCGMTGPCGDSRDAAGRTYNVVAKLVDDVILAMSQMGTQISDMLRAGQTFIGARREHPPY